MWIRICTVSQKAFGDIMVQATRDVLMDSAQSPGALPGQHPNNGGVFAASVAMIGHGGFDQDGRDRAVLGGTISVDAGRHVTANAGNTLDTYTMIGHGGRIGTNATDEPLGHLGGEIDVRARTGDITFTGGEGQRAWAMIGNGGREVRPQNQLPGINTDVTVRADQGNIVFQGGGNGTAGGANESFAMIGNGGMNGDFLTAGQGFNSNVVSMYF